MNSIIPYIPLLVQGASATLAALLITGALSFTIGTFIGIISCNYLTNSSITVFVSTYTFIAKGIPAYVQILIAYFAIPSLLGINLPGFAAACGALAFCSSGYVIEIIRSGINSIPRGQWEACYVLGYPLRATIMRIILPQAMAQVAPTLFGELEQLIKSSALFATIGVMEITRAGMNIISRELNPLPVYFTVACMYLAFSAIIQTFAFFVERRLRNGYRY